MSVIFFSIEKGRVSSLFYFRFTIFLAFLLACFSVKIEAQKFYIGTNNFGLSPRPIDSFVTSFYQYNFRYENYPAMFTARSSISPFMPSNHGIHFGYQFKKRQFIEISYNYQFYPEYADFVGSSFAYGYSDKKSINIGGRYKYNFFSMPLSILNYRAKSPFRLMAFLGGAFQLNSDMEGADGKKAYVGQNFMINVQHVHTTKPQFLLHTGLEAEIPLIGKGLVITVGYSWHFSFGHQYVTTHYTGQDNGLPVDGYRYLDGGGRNFSIGLRWYLPGGTDIPQPPALRNGKNFYVGVEYFRFVNSHYDRSYPGSRDDQSGGLIAGYRKGHHIMETGITPLPSLLRYETGSSSLMGGGDSDEKRWYLPLRYKRVVPVFKKGQSQNLEFLPSGGFGLHLPVIQNSSTSYFPDGSLASDHQKVNNLVLGAELGLELALNVSSFTLSLQARYLHGFSNTRQLQVFDSNAQPTGNFISSTPTGWLHGVAVRYRLGK